MTPTRILVTGTDGMLGRWVSDLLVERGHHVIAVDKRPRAPRPSYDTYVCDILDADRLMTVFATEQPQAVIHLAARTDLDKTATLADYNANTDGVRNVCRAVRATGSVQRAVYTSSQLVCKVGYTPASDTDYCPTTVYGRSKVRTEQIVRELDGGGVPWCLTRPTTVWGPHMNAHYQALLRYIQQGRYFHAGRRPLMKSYAYAANIAHQYRQLVLAPPESIQGKVFYLADYDPLSLRDYTDGLQRRLGARSIPTVPLALARGLAKAGDALNALGLRRFPFNSFRLTNILTEYVIDLSETEAVCGPLPVSVEEGLDATAAWYLAMQGR